MLLLRRMMRMRRRMKTNQGGVVDRSDSIELVRMIDRSIEADGESSEVTVALG